MYRFVIKCIVSVHIHKKEVSSTNVNLQKGLEKSPKMAKKSRN